MVGAEVLGYVNQAQCLMRISGRHRCRHLLGYVCHETELEAQVILGQMQVGVGLDALGAVDLQVKGAELLEEYRVFAGDAAGEDAGIGVATLPS